VNDDLSERTILVTGGSLGIGRAISSELARRGARVVVAARGQEAITETVTSLPGRGHHGIMLDVSDAAAWTAAIAAVDRQGPLRGLVCCAGSAGPVGRFDEISTDAFIETLAVNLLGTLLALRHAVPRLERNGGRAVVLSGGGATSPLPRYDAYATSKAAVVRLVENVAETTAVEINALAPGFVATRIHQTTLDAGPELAGAEYYARTREQLDAGGFPASEAAELTCVLLSDATTGVTGRLLSAQWDPWREQEFWRRLRADPGLGRLRRIDDQQFSASPRAAAPRS